VRIRRGPAAVTGDEPCSKPLFLRKREGAGIRPIREPESLSEPASHTLRYLRGEGLSQETPFPPGRGFLLAFQVSEQELNSWLAILLPAWHRGF